MKSFYTLLLISVSFLTACEAPDIKGLNGMSKTTNEMNEGMKETNEAIRMQKLGLALEGLNKFENQQLILPLPTGLMAFGKLFGESATATEIVELTYTWTREIEEILPIQSLDKEDNMNEPTEADLNKIRLQKKARLYSLMVIAGFAQEEKVTEIINNEILGYGRYQESALNFLALRAYFFREVMLKTSLKVDSGSDGTLDTSGKMLKALEFLTKLDRISKLPFADAVHFKISEKYFSLVNEEERQDEAGRQKTADMWQLALEKAEAGMAQYKIHLQDRRLSIETTANSAEVNRQKTAVEEIRKQAQSWKSR